MGNLNNSRIETLDWLRGLMALSIMFYHLIYWIFFPLDASNPLGRLGVYGVSIFFILSGLSMAIVYNNHIKSIKESIIFFLRRIFRIWPLLWVATFILIVPLFIKGETVGWKFLFLNLTTLFGFISPTSYIATGAWSIGNEMVYYSLTPLILFLYDYKKWVGNIFLAICLSIGIFFAFNLLDPNESLANPVQWALYVNPLNNLFLYVIGIAIFYNFKGVNINSKLNITILITVVALFCLLPFKDNQICIVSGFGRIIFSILSSIIVLCFYKLDINLPSSPSKLLETFGIATYGIYLIHPIVYIYLNGLFGKINLKNDLFLFSSTIIITILLSIFSYKYFELRLIKIGKKVTSKLN